MTIFLILISLISIGVAVYCAYSKKTIDTATELTNKKIKEDNDILSRERQKRLDELEYIKNSKNNLEIQIEEGKKHLSSIQDSIENTKQISQDAFNNYAEILDNQYKKTEEEYNILIENLKTAYSNQQLQLLAESDKVRGELNKIKATRTAAIEANLREKEIEEKLSFYCLDIAETDKEDIAKLERLKLSLNKPRVLSMLIWQTWFQKTLKALANNVVGINDKTGIYKITNTVTKECYIGQAINIKDRWTEHAKCGLGIDTPAGNKLYKAMQEYGLWNFSFELLEECPREQLNEKERYYIDLYNSYEYGYNSNKGNK